MACVWRPGDCRHCTTARGDRAHRISRLAPGTRLPGGSTRSRARSGLTVDTQRWQRIGAIFDEMVEAPVDARAALLDRLCGDDAKLRGEVEALLAADGAADRFDRDVDSARNCAVADWAENNDVQAVCA